MAIPRQKYSTTHLTAPVDWSDKVAASPLGSVVNAGIQATRGVVGRSGKAVKTIGRKAIDALPAGKSIRATPAQAALARRILGTDSKGLPPISVGHGPVSAGARPSRGLITTGKTSPSSGSRGMIDPRPTQPPTMPLLSNGGGGQGTIINARAGGGTKPPTPTNKAKVKPNEGEMILADTSIKNPYPQVYGDMIPHPGSVSDAAKGRFGSLLTHGAAALAGGVAGRASAPGDTFYKADAGLDGGNYLPGYLKMSSANKLSAGFGPSRSIQPTYYTQSGEDIAYSDPASHLFSRFGNKILGGTQSLLGGTLGLVGAHDSGQALKNWSRKSYDRARLHGSLAAGRVSPFAAWLGGLPNERDKYGRPARGSLLDMQLNPEGPTAQSQRRRQQIAAMRHLSPEDARALRLADSPYRQLRSSGAFTSLAGARGGRRALESAGEVGGRRRRRGRRTEAERRARRAERRRARMQRRRQADTH